MKDKKGKINRKIETQVKGFQVLVECRLEAAEILFFVLYLVIA